MKRICEWAMALLFSGVLLVLMAATILLPKNRYSYYENRNLSAFPEISGGIGPQRSGLRRPRDPVLRLRRLANSRAQGRHMGRSERFPPSRGQRDLSSRTMSLLAAALRHARHER